MVNLNTSAGNQVPSSTTNPNKPVVAKRKSRFIEESDLKLTKFPIDRLGY